MLVQSLPASHIADQLAGFAEMAFKVEERSENVIAITTPFTYLYDDPITLYLSRNSDEAYILSDLGDTRAWLNEFKGNPPDRGLSALNLDFWRIECQLYRTTVSNQQHLVTEVNPYNIWPAAFRLIQTIAHIQGMNLADD